MNRVKWIKKVPPADLKTMATPSSIGSRESVNIKLEMYTSKILVVTVVVLVLAAGVPLAAVTDGDVEKESVAPQEHSEKSGEDQGTQDEVLASLSEAVKRWNEARISLLNAHGMEPTVEHVDYATQTSEFASLFEEFDSDGDSGLSLEELKLAIENDLTDKQKSLAPNGLLAELVDLHSEWDRDSDGSFTLDEVTDYFVEAAQELNELRDKKLNEQRASESNETNDGGD